MGAYLRGAWAAFAKCPAAGVLHYGWREYSNSTSTASLLQLGLGNVSSNDFSPLPSYAVSQAYDSLCGKLSDVGEP